MRHQLRPAFSNSFEGHWGKAEEFNIRLQPHWCLLRWLYSPILAWLLSRRIYQNLGASVRLRWRWTQGPELNFCSSKDIADQENGQNLGSVPPLLPPWLRQSLLIDFLAEFAHSLSTLVTSLQEVTTNWPYVLCNKLKPICHAWK